MLTVEKCKNWSQLFMTHGAHCFNCSNRNGYPYRAQPSRACENFVRLPTKRALDGWRCPECDTANADDVPVCECGYSKSRRK